MRILGLAGGAALVALAFSAASPAPSSPSPAVLVGAGDIAACLVQDGSTLGVLRLTLGGADFRWDFVPVAGSTFQDSGTATCHAPPPVSIDDVPTSLAPGS